MRKHSLATVLSILALALLGGDCSGDGSGGDPPTIEVLPLDDRCVPLIGKFPSGFAMLPGDAGHAAAVLFNPAAVFFLDINGDTPRLLARDDVEYLDSDTDGDGVDDVDRPLCEADPRYKSVQMGSPIGVNESLAFVATSDYEQVLFAESPTGALRRLDVTNPSNPASGSFHAEDYPLLPAEGETQPLTAVSTKACVYLGEETGIDPVDSSGRAIGSDVCCDRLPDVPSFVTRLTAGMTIAGGHLFVATSNLYRAAFAQYLPGTVLVYDLDDPTSPTTIQPNSETPILFTTGFNPTGVASYTNAQGRDLVLVSLTGAIAAGTGPDAAKTEAFVDVIDATTRRIVATFPLGLAGLSFTRAAIDPAGRIAILGSAVTRKLLAIDLAPLDDPALFAREEKVWLDGRDPEFPDARIFTADDPFEIPAREDGPPARVCAGWTNVAINASGRQAYATDRCDGTLAIVDIVKPTMACDPAGPAPDSCCDRVPLPQPCFALNRVENVKAPFTEPLEPHAPDQIEVRAGEPGFDYSGPDVFFLTGLPQGELCGVRVESIAPSP